MKHNKLSGVFAAIATPIDRAGQPDTDRFARHARWLLANGCDGLNVLGTTGEANSFSFSQRTKVMEAAASAFNPAGSMVGTGTPDLATSIELTKIAYQLGYGGALILPPYYYKGVSDDGLFDWFARIAEATDVGPIPIYLYNFPQMTGIRFSPSLVRRLADRFAGRIVGAKDSSGDLDYAAELAAAGDLAIFPSDEAALSRASSDRFAGCISATVNVSAPISARLLRDQQNEDLLAEVRRTRKQIAAFPLIPAVKYLIGRLHEDSAYEHLLPPLMPLDGEQKTALEQFPLEIATASAA